MPCGMRSPGRPRASRCGPGTGPLGARPILALLCGIGLLHGAERRPTIFASASLTGAVGELAKAYESGTGVRITASFAAASTLAKQIEHGAPADIFLPAD